ncbi:hypothetical protein G6F45_009602 [Rhizopus arrhizus]|nr:hypothetical protein G6F45_009602 [Rhizopus arrhizus]
MNEFNYIQLSDEQKEQLYQEFKLRARIEEEAREGEFDIPEEILENLDNTSKGELKTQFKRYHKSLPQYKRGTWTSAETINKCFHADLKRNNLDSYQVVCRDYRHSEKLRTAATAATEIYEELSSLIDGENHVLINALEKARRLAVFAFANAKFIDQEAKELAAKALKLPPSIRNFAEEEETDKILAFSSEKVEQVHKALIEEASSSVAEEVNHFETRLKEASVDKNLFLDEAIQLSQIFGTDQLQHCHLLLNRTNEHNSSPILLINNPLYISRQPLRDSGGWDITRWTPSNFYSLLEEDYPPSMTTIGDSRGLPNSVEFNSTPLEIPSNKMSINGRSNCCERSSKKILGCGNHRNITNPKQTLLIPFLYCQGTDKKKTHIGLQTFEQIRPVPPLQDGRDTSFAITSRERRSHLQDRLERCICSGASPSTIQTISNLFTSGNGIPIQVPSVWLKCSSQDLFQTHALCGGTIEEKGNKISLLPGRHMLSSKIDEGNEREYARNFSTPKESRFSYQLQEEQLATTEDSRISGFSIQYFNDANHTPSAKTKEDCKQNSSSKEIADCILLQMDSQFNRENDCSNSSNRRSIDSSPFSAEGLSEEPARSSSKLGKPLSTNTKKFRRSTMVGKLLRTTQRSTYPQGGFQNASNRYLRRCIRQRLRSKQRRTRDSRILDQGRTVNFNKRKRVEDCMDCPATTRRKTSKQCYQDIFGQHHSNKICDESRGNSVANPSGPSPPNTVITQQVPDTPSVCSYPRNQSGYIRSK